MRASSPDLALRWTLFGRGRTRVRRAARVEHEASSSPRRRQAPSADRWWFLVSAFGVVLAALLLRVHRLDAEELWIDEALSFLKATVPGWLGRPALQENTPPLYYVLLRLWTTLPGASEAALRALSAVAGTLYVVVVIWGGREILGPRVGLWSGVVAAVNPIHIYYSQEARAYVLLTVALLLGYVTLWRALGADTWRAWTSFSLCAVLSLASHYSAVLGLIPTALLVAVWPDPPRGWHRWLRYGGALLPGAVLLALWLAWRFLFPASIPPEVNSVAWVQVAWEQTPPSVAVLRSLEIFALGSQAGLVPIFLKQYSHVVFPGWLRGLGLVTHVLLGLWVATSYGDRRLGVPWLGRRKLWLGTLVLFPLASLWLISVVHKPIYLAGRYDLVGFPAFPLLLGLGLAKAQGLRRGGSLVVSLVALLVFGPIVAKLAYYYRASPGSEGRTIASLLRGRAADGDVFVFTGPHGASRLYYATRGGLCESRAPEAPVPCRLFPREAEFDRRVYGRRPILDPAAVKDDVSDFLRRLGAEASLWLIVDRGTFAMGRLRIPAPEAYVVRELERLGFWAMPEAAHLGVFSYRRA